MSGAAARGGAGASGTPADWIIRPVESADLDQIVALERQIFVNDAWSPDTWRAELANESTHYLVLARADDPAVVAGYAGLLSLPGSDDADIQTIAVAPEARRHGFGRELMRRLHEEAARRGVREVFLDVRVDNERAQTLYLDFGYEPIGIRKGYYQPDDVDAIVMRLVLRAPTGPGPVGRESAADAPGGAA